MKITSIEIIALDQPHKGRLIFATGPTPASNNFILMKIHTDTGHTGIGSSYSYPDAPLLKSGVSREGAMVLMKDMARMLIGEDPRRTHHLLNRLETSINGWYSENWYVLGTFDCALYDLKGKILGVPVHDLLGGIQRDRIPLEHIQSFLPTPEEAAAEAKAHIDAGFRSIKLHVNADPKNALARFRAMRDTLGAEVPIGVDMGMAYNLSGALRTIEQLDEYGLNFVEQPLPAYDVEGHVLLRSKTRVPLIADHGMMSVGEAFGAIKAGAYDGGHCLVCRVGGIHRAVKWADLMDQAFLDYQICNQGNSIAAAAGAHFAVTRRKSDRFNDELSLFLYLHGTMDTASITDDIVKTPGFVIENGTLRAPGDAPGLGVELVDEAVEHYRHRDLPVITVK
ncbi:mandelate racemase/muconate lactonizing enzyme family protein [Ruixingdingia sedimenti]|uniref:Enolase C-terminal domain-like protein n=1 Tax=Ruixingdingia sedimenti TaxID=3073604 RepID=A0ABU1FA92_9RHOB|nr:enolase C-terminal domain-like protein [Xinfangfangia sp. LG-4]MDR5653342.1 enolase C-terminal domain-like protein [Xinfangfangia sp. LG-4]